MKKLFVTLSAVPLSLARPHLKNFKKHYPEIFREYGSGRKKARIIIPLNRPSNIRKEAKVEAPSEIEKYLEEKGYEIENYVAGWMLDSKGRTLRMGPFLKEEAPDLSKKFNHDPIRAAHKAGANGVAVVSCHPYDIIGMSFNRGWTSCLNVQDGMFKDHLKSDIAHGVLVAYFVKDDDKNINNPISRIRILPYKNESGTVYFRPGKMYGAKSRKFEDHILEFCDKLNKSASSDMYRLDSEIYSDGEPLAFYVGKPTLDELKSDDFKHAAYAVTVTDEDHIQFLADHHNRLVSHSICRNKLISFENLLKFAKNFDYASLMHSINTLNLGLKQAMQLFSDIDKEYKDDALSSLLEHYGESYDIHRQRLTLDRSSFKTDKVSGDIVARLLLDSIRSNNVKEFLVCANFNRQRSTRVELNADEKKFVLDFALAQNNDSVAIDLCRCSILPDDVLLEMGAKVGNEHLLSNQGISIQAASTIILDIAPPFFSSCLKPSANIISAMLESEEMLEIEKSSIHHQRYLVQTENLNSGSEIQKIFDVLREADRPYIVLVTVRPDRANSPLVKRLKKMVPEDDYQRLKESYYWNFDDIRK